MGRRLYILAVKTKRAKKYKQYSGSPIVATKADARKMLRHTKIMYPSYHWKIGRSKEKY